jgi:hypothetical protein
MRALKHVRVAATPWVFLLLGYKTSHHTYNENTTFSALSSGVPPPPNIIETTLISDTDTASFQIYQITMVSISISSHKVRFIITSRTRSQYSKNRAGRGQVKGMAMAQQGQGQGTAKTN